MYLVLSESTNLIKNVATNPEFCQFFHAKVRPFQQLVSGMCTRPSEPRPRRDVAASETLAETLKLPRLESLGNFNVSLRRFPWRMVKHIDNEKIIRIINSHRGKHFLFLILWVFAL